MVCNLLKPCEKKPWAPSNWILVRFWKGCGFGFRFVKSPHMMNRLGPKPTHSESSTNCPLNSGKKINSQYKFLPNCEDIIVY